MKKVCLIAGLFLLWVFILPLYSSLEVNDIADSKDLSNLKNASDFNGLFNNITGENVWEETVMISPTWQKIAGTFFGLNLHNESTEMSFNELVVYFMAFLMVFIIIMDTLRYLPLFNSNSIKFLVAVIVTLLISISGALISLKNIFVAGVIVTLARLDWGWINYSLEHPVLGVILTMFIIIPILFIIHEAFDLGEAIIKKYSKISRAEAKGRLVSGTVNKNKE